MSDVRVERVGAVAWLRLARPEVRNAVRASTAIELHRALRELAEDSALAAVVLTGDGTAFCSGQDLGEAAALLAQSPGEPELRVYVQRLQDLTRLLRALPVPVVAAVNGPAVGLGAELAVACDIRIAVDAATLQLPEVQRGQLATNGSTALLPALVGSGRASLLMLTGRAVDAVTAERWGLVDEVVPADQLVAAVERLLDDLQAGSRSSARRTLELLRARHAVEVEGALWAETEALIAHLLQQGAPAGSSA